MSLQRVHHEVMVYIHPCSLCSVHSCTFSSMQWEDACSPQGHSKLFQGGVAKVYILYVVSRGGKKILLHGTIRDCF